MRAAARPAGVWRVNESEYEAMVREWMAVIPCATLLSMQLPRTNASLASSRLESSVELKQQLKALSPVRSSSLALLGRDGSK